MNILTFDLEDWYQLVHRRITGELIAPRDTVIRQMEGLLALLDTHSVKATFFVLGMVAERYGDLVRRIAAAGHEIASHGYSHRLVHQLSQEQFRRDSARSKDLLEQLVGAPVRGFRAPEFSINRGTLWALGVLAELGFTYDSSIFPIRHRRYGIPGFDLQPQRYDLVDGLSIVEIPLATIVVRGIRIPIAGGGYFRLLPLAILSAALTRVNAEQRPIMTYFHPYEFDVERLDAFRVIHPADTRQRLHAWRMNLHQNLGRGAPMFTKLKKLMQQFRFVTCEEYLNGVELATNRDLLSAEGASVRRLV